LEGNWKGELWLSGCTYGGRGGWRARRAQLGPELCAKLDAELGLLLRAKMRVNQQYIRIVVVLTANGINRHGNVCLVFVHVDRDRYNTGRVGSRQHRNGEQHTFGTVDVGRGQTHHHIQHNVQVGRRRKIQHVQPTQPVAFVGTGNFVCTARQFRGEKETKLPLLFVYRTVALNGIFPIQIEAIGSVRGLILVMTRSRPIFLQHLQSPRTSQKV
jgi:hypothetical protein